MPTQRFKLNNKNFDEVFSLLHNKIQECEKTNDIFVNGNEILGLVCLAHKDYLNAVHAGIKSHKQGTTEEKIKTDRNAKIDKLLNLAFVCTQSIASLNSYKTFTKQNMLNASKEIEDMLYFRFRQKGPGAYASSHEILGILQEEYVEFEEEVKLDVKSRESDILEERVLIDRDEKIKELKDIAVGALWGITSIKTGAVDW